jgi:hypothetical protein
VTTDATVGRGLRVFGSALGVCRYGWCEFEWAQRE